MIVKDPRLQSDFYTAFVWAIFNLAATQLALVLGGPIAFLIVILTCGSIFTLFLSKATDKITRTRKKITKPYLLSTGMLLMFTILYLNLVFLDPGLSDVMFVSAHIILYLIPMLIAITFSRKRSHVPQ